MTPGKPGLADAQERFYKGPQRAFRLGKAVGPWWESQTSILQGSALSQHWINLINTLWARLMRQGATTFKLGGFVDDRSPRTRGIEELQERLRRTVAFDKATGQTTEPEKSDAWTTSRKPAVVKEAAHTSGVRNLAGSVSRNYVIQELGGNRAGTPKVIMV